MASDPDFTLDPNVVLAPSFAGCGAQLNENVYAAITGAPLTAFAELEQKVVDLRPQLVRIFYNDAQAAQARDQLESFLLTVELAQRAGATINVTWQSGGVDTPDESMARFAAVLSYLVSARGVTNLRWVTIQNEPNSTKITPEQNAVMYRALDRHLTDAGVRGQIRFMGGDLVRKDQAAWFEYMAAHLADLLDAYSIHIYWHYWEPEKIRQRLDEVHKIVAALPPAGRKPVFVTEFGVRGRPAPNEPNPGVYADGTPISRTNIAGFQQAWLYVVAARFGYAGAVKWDCYAAKYDRGTQAYFAIGPWQDGWPLYPTYFLLRLLTQSVEGGWSAIYAKRSAGAPARPKDVAAFAGPGGEVALVGLSEAGGSLNGASARKASFAIGGVDPRTRFTLAAWNLRGDGRTSTVGEVAADAAGVVSVTIPLHTVFALTTRRI